MERLPIDLADALARIGDDREFLRELLDIYREDLATKLAALRDALDRGDLGTVEQLGHALKGSSANLSLLPLRDRAAAIELAGKAGDAAKALANLNGLEKEYRRLREHLRENPV